LLDALLGWVLFTGGSVLISSSLRHAAYWEVWQPLLTTLLGSLCCFLSCSLASSFPRRHSPDLPRSSSYWIATSGRSLWASWPSGRPTAFSPGRLVGDPPAFETHVIG
jgi:drug/metabolite transporter (DMT)-like permease